MDTHPEAEGVQIRLLREAGIKRRFELMCSLTQTVLELSRNAIRRRYPKLSEQEVGLKFVALCYGDELARQVRNYLERRGA